MTRIPTKAEILDWISANPTQTSKREIAKAFGIKGAGRIDLKQVLKELEAEGHLEKRKRSYRDPDRLPPVSILQVKAPNTDGDLFARPLEWHGEGVEPIVLVIPRASDPALGEGDRILARLTVVTEEDHNYEARLIRRIGTNPKRILGVFRKRSEGGRIVPIEKSASTEWQVADGAQHGAKDGELVEAEQAGPKGRMGLPRARVVARLGDPSAPRAVSLIAIHQHGIPDTFPDAAIAEADAAKPVGLAGREDLRDMPLITIDPSDARDHDDACYAHPDDDPKNPDGHVVWVAIADVAAYVRHGLGPRGAQAGQFQLLPGPGGADAAGPAIGGSVLAARGGTPGLCCGADAAGRQRPQDRAQIYPRSDAVRRVFALRRCHPR